MNIIKEYGDFSNKDKYDFLVSGTSEKMANARDIVRIDKYIIAEDTDENGNNIKVLMVKDIDGTIYGTISKTFIEKFTQCVDMFGDDFKAFSVASGTSNNGREYITCVYED